MAALPYTAEFNGKIKYIRDFFITLFFVGLGMQIPAPTIEAIGTALLVCCVVLLFRWAGIFCIVLASGGPFRLAAVSTINLSQISEFGLVICSLGVGFDHVDAETMAILIWTFSILAVASAYFIGYNQQIHAILKNKCTRKQLENAGGSAATSHDDEDHEDHRNIVLLGCFN